MPIYLSLWNISFLYIPRYDFILLTLYIYLQFPFLIGIFLFDLIADISQRNVLKTKIEYTEITISLYIYL